MKALITGINGMDGSYLAELLLDKGYEVHGLIRRSSTGNLIKIQHLMDQEAIFNRRLFLHNGDMADGGSLHAIIQKVKPDEIYNLAAMSQVRISFDEPEYTMDITGLGFTRLVESAKGVVPKAKIYQASSSEMFGKVLETPQNEKTPFNPVSPYGEAKQYAFYRGRNYREGEGLNIYNGILFNHESPRRGEEFLSKKVVKAAVRIKKGLQDKLYLGNLDAKRDMGYAKEYVYWMWKIMQHPIPDDFVIGSGETHTMKEFVEKAFGYLDLDWKKYVEIDKDLFRPSEVNILVADYSKAKKELGFEPKVRFDELIKIMVDAEVSDDNLHR